MNNFKELEKELEKDNKYKRKVCVKCEYKLICAGECEETINSYYNTKINYKKN